MAFVCTSHNDVIRELLRFPVPGVSRLRCRTAVLHRVCHVQHTGLAPMRSEITLCKFNPQVRWAADMMYAQRVLAAPKARLIGCGRPCHRPGSPLHANCAGHDCTGDRILRYFVESLWREACDIVTSIGFFEKLRIPQFHHAWCALIYDRVPRANAAAEG